MTVKQFYNANGIDLRTNFYESCIEYRNKVVKEFNQTNKALVQEYNDNLKLEIKEYNKNKSNDEPKRYISVEKKKFNRLKISDFPVKFYKTHFIFRDNKYIELSDLTNIMNTIIDSTQTSPMSTPITTDTSDNSDSE